MADRLDRITFAWDIHWECNYRCPYCWWHNRWEEIKTQNYYPGVDRLMETWKRIQKRYGSVHLEISGGEPMLYPGFSDFLSRVLEYHSVGIITNLSGDVEGLVRKVADNKERFGLGATFHPLFADLDEFREKLLFLRKKDFVFNVLYLAWPPQVEKIPFYREKFKEKDLPFSVLTFWGEYRGKEYPGSYTKREREIINPHLGERSGERFQVKPLVTQGKLCNAGYTYGTIHPDGKVLRCGGGSWKKEDKAVGNIFDEDFRLLNKPQPCPAKHCPCNEWAFLLVDK